MTATTSRTPPPARRAHRRATSQRDARGARDTGSASVEIAILFPVALLLVTAIVQYGLWFHARSIALAAAQEGVTAARLYQADLSAGPDRALAFVETHGSDTLTEVAASATLPGPDQISVQVTGRALSLLPGLPGLAVSQSAEGPIERFTTAGGP